MKVWVPDVKKTEYNFRQDMYVELIYECSQSGLEQAKTKYKDAALINK